MKLILLGFFLGLAVATNALQISKFCSQGPAYWCSSPAAAAKCGAVEFCRQLFSRQKSLQIPTSTSTVASDNNLKVDDCATCQQVLDSVKQAVAENQTAAQISQALKMRLCGQLGPRSDACVEVTDLMIGEVLRMVVKNVNPLQLCTLLGLCSQTSPIAVKSPASVRPVAVKSPASVRPVAVKSPASVRPVAVKSPASVRPVAVKSPAAAPTSKLYASHPVLLLMQLQTVSWDKKPLSRVAGGSQTLCQALVFRARVKQIGGDRDTAVAVLRAACQLATDRAERDRCDSSLQANSPLIHQLLSSSLKPAAICRVLGAQAERVPTSDGLASCLVCKQALREIARRTSSTSSRPLSLQSVKAALPGACASLPYPHQRPQCRRLTEESSAEIGRLMLQGFGPRLVCSKLGRCSNSGSSSSSRHGSLAFEPRQPLHDGGSSRSGVQFSDVL